MSLTLNLIIELNSTQHWPDKFRCHPTEIHRPQGTYEIKTNWSYDRSCYIPASTAGIKMTSFYDSVFSFRTMWQNITDHSTYHHNIATQNFNHEKSLHSQLFCRFLNCLVPSSFAFSFQSLQRGKIKQTRPVIFKPVDIQTGKIDTVLIIKDHFEAPNSGIRQIPPYPQF